MARVTDAEVKAIIDTSRSVDPFIATATLLVNEELAASTTLSSERLQQIELYLAAHFTAITEERGALTSSEKGDASEEYGVEVGSGLNSTRYGQQAISLDTSGRLAAIASSGNKARFTLV